MGEEEGEFEVLAYVLKSGVRDLSLNKFLDLTDFLCTSNSQLSPRAFLRTQALGIGIYEHPSIQ